MNSIENALNAAMKEGVEKNLRDRLSHMKDEVEKNNTVITFNQSDSKILISGDSKEVNKRIAAELTK